MADKKEIEKSLEYARGYRDALVNTWEEILKMATKGYSSHEIQIVAKTKSVDAINKIELKIKKLEEELAQDDIIDTDELPLTGIAEEEPILEVVMKPRMSYLVKEPKPTRCYDMMHREYAKDRPILVIARTSPSIIREEYDIGKSTVIWLTMKEKLTDNLPPSALGVADKSHDFANANDEYVKPGELPKLYSLALNFIDGNSDGLILFEGFEYLVTHNSFQSLMNFLQKINEDVGQKGFNLVLSVNSAAFEPKDLSQLESEVGQVIS